MVTLRRGVGLGLTVALFVLCFVSSHTPTFADNTVKGKPKGTPKGTPKHPVLHKTLKELHAAHHNLKELKPHFDGHREKAMKHIDQAIHEVKQAIEVANEEAAK